MKIYQRRNPKVEAMQFAKEEDYFDIAKWMHSVKGPKCSDLRRFSDRVVFQFGATEVVGTDDWVVKESGKAFCVYSDDTFRMTFVEYDREAPKGSGEAKNGA